MWVKGKCINRQLGLGTFGDHPTGLFCLWAFFVYALHRLPHIVYFTEIFIATLSHWARLIVMHDLVFVIRVRTKEHCLVLRTKFYKRMSCLNARALVVLQLRKPRYASW